MGRINEKYIKEPTIARCYLKSIKAKLTNMHVKINSKSRCFYVKKRIHFIEKYGMFRQRVSDII